MIWQINFSLSLCLFEQDVVGRILAAVPRAACSAPRC